MVKFSFYFTELHHVIQILLEQKLLKPFEVQIWKESFFFLPLIHETNKITFQDWIGFPDFPVLAKVDPGQTFP
jgi:hypothetical protein